LAVRHPAAIFRPRFFRGAKGTRPAVHGETLDGFFFDSRPIRRDTRGESPFVKPLAADYMPADKRMESS
jgi:hypothetical protein